MKVMYVDDEIGLLEIGKIHLEKSGFSITTVESARKAIKILKEESFDAIVSDYQMPNCDGIDFLKYLRKMNDKTPFIIFTGRGREDVVIEALNSGADFYLQKGGDLKAQFTELAHKICYAVNKRKGELELLKNNEELEAADQEMRAQLDEILIAQKQLLISEDRYRAIFEYTKNPTIIIEEDTSIFLANHAFAEVSGFSQKELIGKSWTEFVSLFDVEKMIKNHQQRRSNNGSGPPANYEFTFVDRYGNSKFIHLTVGMIPGTKQSVASLYDLTENEETKKLLCESELIRNHIVEAIPDILFMLDGKGKFLEIITTNEDLLISPKKEIINKEIADFISKEDEKIIIDSIKKTLKNQEMTTIEYVVPLSSGSRYFEARIVPYLGDQVLALARDMTDKKELEKSLRESEEHFRFLVNHSYDLIWKLSSDGSLLYLSPSWKRMLGYNPLELKGRSFQLLVHPEDISICEDYKRKTIEIREASSGVEYRIKHVNGSWLWHEGNITPVFDNNDSLLYFIGTSRDITDRKKYEQSLNNANKKLKLLFSITRHDILNQIMVLQGYIDMTIPGINDPKLSEFLKGARNASNKIYNQIGFTKDYENLGTHRPAWQSLSGIIKRINDSSLLINHNCEDVFICADLMFEKVVYNLYDNTIRHAEGATNISVDFSEKHGNLVITWSDNGSGVPANQKQRIFEKGFGKNNGFGLFLVREILSITNITIREIGDHKGAVFEITVPANYYKMGSK